MTKFHFVRMRFSFTLMWNHLLSDKQVLDYHLDKLMTKDESKILASDIALQKYLVIKKYVLLVIMAGKNYTVHKIYDTLSEEDIHIGYMPENYDEFWMTDHQSIS